jgi:hypothetical protein
VAATYTTDNGEITAIVAELIANHCVDLRRADVTFDVLLAASPDPDKNPPVKEFGLRTYAVAKVMKLADRVAGSRDVRIIVDQERFDAANPARKRAILHGQLARLRVVFDANGPATDDAMRPKIRLSKLDYATGGMIEIAERYGPDAPEYAVYQALGLDQRQEAA